MPEDVLISANEIPCCPDIAKEPCCERLQFSYRLQNRLTDVPVEVIIVAELERCPGPLSLGDVVYSTTLLPGEKVRLHTSTRNSRFSYDSESEVNYRHEQASEETFYMASMDRYMSDLTIRDEAEASSQSHSDFEVNASADYWTALFAGGGSASADGNFNGSSSADFVRELSQHAQASHDRSVQATRAANSIAVGEVQSRSHAEGESESAYEASTRVFENKNDCHAVTYFAYQLVKKQTLRFRIKAVLRRVLDRAGDSRVDARPVRPPAGVAVIPSGVLATKANRLEVETVARTSAAAYKANVIGAGAGTAGLGNIAFGSVATRTLGAALRIEPIPEPQRQKALRAVDEDLVKAGVIEKVGGNVSPKLQAELGWERVTCLPTQAIVVKGCLDRCNTCEESRQKSIELSLVHKDLMNKLLAKQIDLLEKSQEYRCCPVSEAEEEPARSVSGPGPKSQRPRRRRGLCAGPCGLGPSDAHVVAKRHHVGQEFRGVVHHVVLTGFLGLFQPGARLGDEAFDHLAAHVLHVEGPLGQHRHALGADLGEAAGDNVGVLALRAGHLQEAGPQRGDQRRVLGHRCQVALGARDLHLACLHGG
jgi:hypothetical protein